MIKELSFNLLKYLICKNNILSIIKPILLFVQVHSILEPFSHFLSLKAYKSLKENQEQLNIK